MPGIEQFFARIGEDPLTCAFEEEKKTLPSVDTAKMRAAPPVWDGGKFEDFAVEAYQAYPDRPLALYVHVPFCHHRCTFCPFYINLTHKTFSTEYSALLSREIADTAHILRDVIHQRPVKAIYFGGGTPSDLSREDMARLIRQLHNTFQIADDAEITVEGRVRGFTEDKGKAWVEAGANRFSLGVQTTDTALRRRLGRLSDKDEIREILNGLCESGASVIVDLMYGFPDQTLEMLVEDIRFLSEETGIHGLDLYELRLFPDSPLEKAIKRGAMPDVPGFLNQAKMFGAAYQKLIGSGFEHFAPKHWRRDSRERSVYNRIARGQTDMIPFGSGAGGRLGTISLGNNSVLTEYTSMVTAGEKPLKRMAYAPLSSEQGGFSYELGEALEKLKLPPITQWPDTHRQQGERLLSQWREAGLLSDKEDEHGIQLTYAGHFWSQRIRKMLLDFVATPVGA